MYCEFINFIERVLNTNNRLRGIYADITFAQKRPRSGLLRVSRNRDKTEYPDIGW